MKRQTSHDGFIHNLIDLEEEDNNQALKFFSR